MRLVSLQMIGSVARNKICSTNWIYDGPNQDILDYWGTPIFSILSYYILSMENICRVERMDVGKISLTR